MSGRASPSGSDAQHRSRLSECHPEAEGGVFIELTISLKPIDPTLVSKFQSWSDVFA